MVTKIHPHPKYRPNVYDLWYDAAILEIHQALTPPIGVIPICLPPPNFTVLENRKKVSLLTFSFLARKFKTFASKIAFQFGSIDFWHKNENFLSNFQTL